MRLVRLVSREDYCGPRGWQRPLLASEKRGAPSDDDKQSRQPLKELGRVFPWSPQVGTARAPGRGPRQRPG